MRDGKLILGLLSWKVDGQSMQAQKFLLSWNLGNLVLSDVFAKICDVGAESVEKMFVKDRVSTSEKVTQFGRFRSGPIGIAPSAGMR